MKKPLLSLLFLLHATFGFSQLVEGFENTTGITGPLPATWTLGSGNWTVFERNFPNVSAGTEESWGINSFASGLQFEGINCASVSREQIVAENTSEDYLVTPPFTVPLNGQFTFYTRMFTSGDQGTVYKIMIAPAFPGLPIPDPEAYTLVQEWTESDLISPASNYDQWTEKTVDLSDYAGIGIDVHVAFVRVHTSSNGTLSGDRWLIDNINLQATPCNFYATANYVTPTSVELNWITTSTEPAEVMILPCDNPAPSSADSGVIANGTSHLFTNLISGNCYKVYIKNFCPMIAGWVNIGITSSLPPIRLTAFLDDNNNGIKETNESLFYYGQFIITTNNSPDTTTSYSTYTYSFTPYLITDVFDFGFSINSNYNACLAVGTLSSFDDIPASNQPQTFYIPVVRIPDCYDNRVVLTPWNLPVPGTIDLDMIKITNSYSSVPQSGMLTYTKAPNIAISSVIPSTGVVLTPTGFTYNFSGLISSGHIELTVRNTIPAIPTVNLGDILTSSASISTDANLSNNSSSISQIVSAAYDPNDINESHGPQIQFDQFGQNDYLTYTIRFQNTGNANAIRVLVNHVLDSRIDETSITMIDARHDYIMVRRENTVSWEFNNIQLPPASVNEDLSNGFITFRVKLKPGFAIRDIIPATASIYFDSNPAIVTETFNTEFVQLLGNPTFNNDSISLSPNPTSDIVTITNNNSMEKIAKVAIYDVTGKRIYNLTDNSLLDIRINVSLFAKGIYLVEILSDNNSKITKKLILK